MLAAARDAGATPILLLNMKKRSKNEEGDFSSSTSDNAGVVDDTFLLRDAAHAARDALDPEHSVLSLEIDLASSQQTDAANRLSEAIAAAVASRGGPAVPPAALPPKYLARDAAVLLVIPMDAETPGGRLLRPQALVQEEALRAHSRVVAVRLDLGAARGERGAEARAEEKERFDEALASMMVAGGRSSSASPRLVVTDSQAIDVVHEWTLGAKGEEESDGGSRSSNSGGGGGGEDECGDDGNEKDKIDSSTSSPQTRRVPLVDVTTFSIAMAARQCGGPEQLALMVQGISAARRLQEVTESFFLLFRRCRGSKMEKAPRPRPRPRPRRSPSPEAASRTRPTSRAMAVAAIPPPSASARSAASSAPRPRLSSSPDAGREKEGNRENASPITSATNHHQN